MVKHTRACTHVLPKSFVSSLNKMKCNYVGKYLPWFITSLFNLNKYLGDLKLLYHTSCELKFKKSLFLGSL